jgi:hypothetical protein
VLPLAASDHYTAQRRLILATLALVRREWATMGEDLDGSWSRIATRVSQLTASAQVGSARNGAAYVPATLAELGQSVPAVAAVVPGALVGAQSLDGLTYGSLDALLYGAVVHARTVDAGSLPERLAIGGRRLDLLVHTQVSDASKQAASVAMTTRPRVSYVRAVTPPCCQRCAVLAGKFSAPTAFDRHPRCDCIAVPTTDPRSVTLTAPEPGQIKDLTAAQRKAIDDGADLGRVINSHRAGARSKDGMTTTELKPRTGQRLTPEGIYRVSATPEEALQRLRDNGYIR